MAYRYLEDIDRKIIEAIIQIGAQEGVPKVSAQKIAAICDISTYTVFDHFKTKRNFIESAAQYFEDILLEKIAELTDAQKNIYEIWDIIMDFFIDNPDDTLYYYSYIHTYGFDPTENNVKSDVFIEMARKFFKEQSTMSNADLLIVWDYVVSSSFYYAEKFIHELFPYDEHHKDLVKNLVFKGVESVLKK